MHKHSGGLDGARRLVPGSVAPRAGSSETLSVRAPHRGADAWELSRGPPKLSQADPYAGKGSAVSMWQHPLDKPPRLRHRGGVFFVVWIKRAHGCPQSGQSWAVVSRINRHGRD